MDRGSSENLEERVREELAPDLEVIRLLGRGAVASVYLAREPALKRLVAVKVLDPELAEDHTARARFTREAQTSGRLSHPNVVPVHGVATLSDGLPYLIMQYVQGPTLDERLRAEGALGVDEVVRILEQLASALASAHERGLVHRDVRPGNVLWDSGTDRAMLADFGLTGLLESGDTPAERLTTAGMVLGKAEYASPEQQLGEPVTDRADIFSLGVVAFQLLAGRHPYAKDTAIGALQKLRTQGPPHVGTVRREVPAALDELVARCMAPEASHRPAARTVAEQARAILRGVGSSSGGATSADHSTAPDSSSALEKEGVLHVLRRKRMPQFAVAIIAAGWVAVSAIDQFVQQGLLPPMVYKLGLVLFAASMLATLIIAWFHGERGSQRISALEVWLLSVLIFAWLAVSSFVLVRG